MPNFTKNGVDVSNHNGTVDFKKLKQNGIDYVYIKATEGTTYRDPKCASHYQSARNSGLKIGFYHYLKGTSSPETQAENCYNSTKQFQHDLVLMLDVEEDWNGMSNYTVRFIKKWKSLCDIPVGIYTYSGFLGNFTSEMKNYCKDLPCWIANYTSNYSNVKTGFFTNVVGWQYSSTKSLAGFKGDFNVFSTDILINKEPVLKPNDTVIADCSIFEDNFGQNEVGKLFKGDKVTVLEYYSDFTKLKSNDSFVYIDSKNLESRKKDSETYDLDKLKDRIIVLEQELDNIKAIIETLMN